MSNPELRAALRGPSLFALAALLMPAAAFAQSAPDGQAAEAENADAIVVTGTRLRLPNLESPVPVTTVSGEEFFQTGQISVGDVLNELPQLRSTFSQQNSTRALGTGGLNLLDLRGLGTVRTLVLVNGRRHVGSDVLGNSTPVDVNTIPTDLIERVDVVTGGSSAVYGSDAIAGVVNFVLKDDFEGLQLRAQNGISKYGDANSYYVSGLAGTNFADGRGNVAVNVEYAHSDAFYAPSRPHTAKLSGYIVQDLDEVDAPNGSDGVPDRLFFEDLRYGYYSDGGTVFDFGPQGIVPYLFQPDGSLVLQTGQRVDDPTFPVPYFLGGNGDNFRSGEQSGLRPGYDRFSVNLIGHFEVSPAFVPFVEATYVRTKSLSNNAGPFFVPAYGIETFRTDNPYLNPQAESLIRQIYGLPDPGLDFDFDMYRSITDLGNREEDAKRETYRIVAGARGAISDNWGYEASVNYGEFREKTTILGNVNYQRYLLSADAVTDPATGQIVCRSQIDPSAAFPNPFAIDQDFAAAALAADVAACVPGNYFGVGALSQAARDYVVQDTVATGKITQFVANAFLTGNTEGFFELPGGPVGLVLGAEYRRETAFYEQDPLVVAGQTFYNSIPTFDPPSFEVKELFGEVRIPVLADMPLAHELTVNLAGRMADYKGATGTVYAYNGSIQYAPIPDVTLRANYSRAVRAPNVSDLYTPLGTNFASNFEDPCSQVFLAQGSANRVANCRADGVPEGYNYIYTSSLQYRSGGNTELREETSDSITVGALLRPRFLPGLSLSVDYFDIEVDDVITSPTAQQIVDACYDASDLDNQFCDLFQRQGAGTGPQGEIEGRILEGSLQASLLNYAQLKVRGIDADLQYSHLVESLNTTFSARVSYTHMLQNDEFLDPTDPGRANQLLLELNYPEDAVNLNLGFDTGKFSFGYQMRYIGKAVLNEYEDLFSKQGRPPENADYAEDRYYTDVFYHDIRLAYAFNEDSNFYLGVDNVGNRLPPQGLSGTGAGSGIYDVVGRYFYAGVKVNFAGLGL
ncbi:TonB-dependent receptor [Novosphingobium sp. PC22D]|uniref:TonB-dependent receptor domain-containing protein n=1 Tax=Novosphingobium sp. PC22D TaxID=1962403 RepID=UPI000BF08153|nr:TonB-dependent receptor [Novosphingobium sp. PC22D]PEQ14763.1 TonB-dependent receptor [Novosphingobium sp. PC22D]